MDRFSTIVLLIIAFLAWYQEITWLFIGLMIILVLTSKSLSLAALFVFAAVITYYLNMQIVWVAMLALAAIAVLLAKRKEASASGMYSPELLRLLGG